MKTETFIKDLPFFASFSEEQVNMLSNYLEHKVFYEGDVLLKQGGKGNELLIVRSGSGDISVFKPGGEKRHVANTQLGNCYGEVSMLTGDIITANIVANEIMECYRFSRDQLKVLRLIEPDLAVKVESAIAVSAVKKIENMVQLARNIYKNRKFSKVAKSFNTLKQFDLIHDDGHEILPSGDKCKLLIRKIPAFDILNDHEVGTLFKYFHIISYEKGAIVRYDDHHSIDVVCSGILQLYDDVLPKISFNEPGSLFGQITYFDENVKIDAFCREDTILIRFPLDQIAMMCNHDFDVWRKFHSILCSQVVKLVYDVDRLILRLESEG